MQMEKKRRKIKLELPQVHNEAKYPYIKKATEDSIKI